MSVLHGLKQGNEVLKEIHREMSIESVERLMEETQEAREYQQVCLHASATLASGLTVNIIRKLGIYWPTNCH